MIELDKKIFVAGHKGMVGSAIVRRLKKLGASQIVTADRAKLDLTNQEAVKLFFREHQFKFVYNAAAKVGGIVGNANYPADFVLENLAIQNNIALACLETKVDRYVFLGSCCIYPKFCDQPMREEYLLTGELEPTNRSYAVAKIAGIVSAQALNEQYGLKSVCPMPINLFGQGDNWDPDNSHIIPGLMRRFHFAKIAGEKESVIWGSGKVRREYMHVDDCAEAIVFLTDKFDSGEIVNVAPGTELTTKETAKIIADLVGYQGRLVQDTSKPDGTARKLADASKISSLGWRPKLDFKEALQDTYEKFQWAIENNQLDRGNV